MTRLDREQKIAFARIITDLIEADFIVEADEMQFFEHIISKDCFSITDAMLIEAKKMDFAKAVNILRELDEEGRAEIVDVLRQLAMSDGTCVPLEAILVFAVEQVLRHNAQIFSTPSIGVDIDNLSVIFVENEDATEANRQIEQQLDSISDALSSVGFHFVYIPGVVNDFRQMPSDYIRKVVKYMMPSASLQRVDDICQNLLGLTTSRFCRDTLYKKLGINLIGDKPSFLIKINDSDILAHYENDDAQRIRFANYLQLEAGNDVASVLHRIVNGYAGLINAPISKESKPESGKFIYHGFHRSLFDLIAYGKQSREYRLVFEISNHKVLVYFESIDEACERIVLKLTPQETSLYFMIVQKSLLGSGLDWREHIPPTEKMRLLSEYNRLYAIIGRSNLVTEYKDRTQVHHIKNRIRVLQSIANVEMFIPEHYRNGNASYYRIRANHNFIRIDSNITL